MMTFPYLASPEKCNGCGVCVRECPVNALELLGAQCGKECVSPSSQERRW